MSWTVEYDETQGIIVDTYIGKCSGQDFRDVAATRIALAKEKGSSKTLVDASMLELAPPTTLDVFDIVEHMYNEKGSRTNWKIAITTPSALTARDEVRFYVNMCKNRGWTVEEFADREEAIQWLIE